ncbi:MAG TPA: shikimate dehydrogenase [Chloroflexota bacterium]|nr:shikimate dehydrogenase [Chloroflexota bacterium]
MRVGLIGYPIKHSISPRFQQAAFDAAGIAARYEAWEVPPERLGAVVDSLRAPDALGANVTIPHKQAVCAFLDAIDPVAAAIGAVNTIVRLEDRLVGYNTDAIGFISSLRADAGTELRGQRVAVIGAGGAARAVVAAALGQGAAAVVIAARRVEPAEAILADLAALNTRDSATQAISLDDAALLRAALGDAAILVNTTPVGMAHRADERDVPVSVTFLRADALVCDLIYNPPRTALLEAAAARGARTLNGLPMLVYQGAAAWELWTKRPAPVALMRRAAEEAL